jgi:hypothetical protein
MIDADDYDVWISQFGQIAPGAGAGSLDGAAVPEPSCGVLLLVSVWIGVAARPASRRR